MLQASNIVVFRNSGVGAEVSDVDLVDVRDIDHSGGWIPFTTVPVQDEADEDPLSRFGATSLER